MGVLLKIARKLTSEIGTESERVAETTANSLIATSTFLRDIAIRLVLDGIPVSVPTPNQNYRVIWKLPKARIFRVVGYGEKSIDSVSGELTVELVEDRIEILRSNNPRIGYADIVVQVNRDKYVYPPKDYVSYLFFKLNPEIERSVLEVISKETLSSDLTSYLIDASLIEKKLDLISLSDEIIADTSFDYHFEAYGTLAFGSEYVKTFRSIEAFFHEEGKEDGFHVTLKVGGKRVTYTLVLGDPHTALTLLLSTFAKRKELEVLKGTAERVREVAAKTYLAFKVLSKIDE
jgi:hypothetical protein